MKEIGAWLECNGEAIYGTRGGPFRPGSWGGSTYKSNTVYLHILDWPEETLALPTIDATIVSASLLETGGDHADDNPVRVEQSGGRIEIHVAPGRRHPLDTIVMLELDKPVSQIQPERVTSDGPG